MSAGPSPATAARGSSDMSIGLLAASVAVTAWGAGGVIAKWLPMDGIVISAYRFAIFAIIVGLWRAMHSQRLTWRALWLSIPGGVALAADVAFFFTALKHTSVVNATIIGALQPLLLTAYGARFLGERLRPRDLWLGAVALAGVIVIVLAGSSTGDNSLGGDLAAVGALFTWSAYFVFAKAADGKVTPTDYTLAVAIIVVVINAPLAFVFGQDLSWPSTESWVWLAIMALGAGLLGHNLMNWGLVRIPLWLGSTMTLFVPVVSSALAWLFLDEQITATQLVAMTVVFVALFTLVYGQTRAANAEAAAGDTLTPSEPDPVEPTR